MSECVLSSSKNPWAIPLRRALGESDCQSRQDKWILVSAQSGSALTDWEELSLCRQACFIFKLINLNKIFYPSLWVLPLWQLCWTGLGCGWGWQRWEGGSCCQWKQLAPNPPGFTLCIYNVCMCARVYDVWVCFLFALSVLLCTWAYAFFLPIDPLLANILLHALPEHPPPVFYQRGWDKQK